MLIDTDPGIDDAMAIIYALSDPELDLVGLTTVFGNVPVEQATRNALALVAYLDREIPVAKGAAQPLEIAPQPHPDFVHGEDGFGGVALPLAEAEPHQNDAADLIIDTVRGYPGEVTLIPIGPLTNLATALRRDHGIAEMVREVVIMGGAYGRGGNVTGFAEANIWQDPHAAEIVFNTRWPMRLVGLNVTEKIRCTQADFDALSELKPKAGTFLRDAVRFYISFHREKLSIDACFLHDPSAVIAAIEPGLLTVDEVPLTAVLEGEQIGATIAAHDGRAPIKICVDVDGTALKHRFLDVIGKGPLP
ncbi:MAG: nucleoside hydrolase [Pseudomonadota bacterium]